jgi:hypothetical protein
VAAEKEVSAETSSVQKTRATLPVEDREVLFERLVRDAVDLARAINYQQLTPTTAYRL